MKEDGKFAVSQSDYKLPVCDTQKQRRNFPGMVKYAPMLPLVSEDWETETDRSDPNERKERM